MASATQTMRDRAFMPPPVVRGRKGTSRWQRLLQAERSLAILARCHRAMAGRGTLLLVERVPPGGADRPWEPFFQDLNMLAGLGGRERGEAEWHALLETAHFSMTRIVPITADASLIEAQPTAAA